MSSSISSYFVRMNVPNYLVIIEKLIFSMYSRVMKTDNCLVKTIAQSLCFSEFTNVENMV